MKKAMQIAYNEHFDSECQSVSLAGFSYIAVNYTSVIGKNADEWKNITEDILVTLDKYSLECVQSHPHYYNPFESSEIVDEEMEFAMRQSIISSAQIGAEYCVFHPRTSLTLGYHPSVSLEDNKKWFSSLIECAVKHGTKIAAENLPLFVSAGRPVRTLFSSNPEHLISLVDSFDCESVGVCWDFGHANMIYGDQSSMIRSLGDRIKCTHIHNNWGTRDDHAPPIYGNIQWDSVMPALASTGYQGPLTLETHCWYNDEALIRSFNSHNYESLLYLERLMENKTK